MVIYVISLQILEKEVALRRLELLIVMEDHGYSDSLRRYLTTEKFTECEVFIKKGPGDFNAGGYDWILLDDKNYRSFLGADDGVKGDGEKIILLTECLEEMIHEDVRTFYKYQSADRLWQYIMGKSTKRTGVEKQVAQCLSFISPIGGVGKTTLSFYCSKALALMGYKVLYISFDYFFNGMGLLKTSGKSNLSDFLFCLEREMEASVINDLIQKDIESGLYHFGSAKAYSDYFEIDDKTIDRLEKWLMSLMGFDYIVLDLCTGFSKDHKKIYEFSSMNFIVMDLLRQNHYFISQLDKLVSCFFNEKRSNIKYVINKNTMLRSVKDETEREHLMVPYMEKREMEEGMVDFFTHHFKREMVER